MNVRNRLIVVFLALALSVLGCVAQAPTPTAVRPTATHLPTPTSVPQPTVIPTSTVTLPPTNTPTTVLTATARSTDTPMPRPTATASQALQVHFIAVGQGDSILILTADGNAVLIDGGEADSGALQYLQSKGIKRLDLVIATHPHSDHIGGLVQMLRTIPVTEVATNGQMHTTSTYEQFLDAIAAAKAKYTEVKRGGSLSVGGLTFAVLSPTSTNGDMNHNSLVLRLVYGKTVFLLMGDADKDAEASILSAGLPVHANVLKVGHHGSRSASSPAFLAQVKPQVAVYCAGSGNDYGHPHAQTLAALAAVGAQVYGTDANGTVVVTSDGNTYKVEVAKQGQPRAPPTAQPTMPATATTAPLPTPKPTAAPTAQPTATTAAVALTLDIVSVSSPIAPGANATLVAKTAPGANCTITVYYKSGPSKAQGLTPKDADANGSVSWTWKVGTNTTPGTWRIVVTASKNGQRVTKETSFVVAK